MLEPTDNRSAIYAILLLAAVLGFAWLVSASLVLSSRQRSGSSGSYARTTK